MKVRAEEEVPTLVEPLRSSAGFSAIICPLVNDCAVAQM